MKFKIKIIITIMVSFVVIVSMCFFIADRNSISISGFNSDNIITGSNNTYLITLKGVPSGNGTYQQLIPINNYTKYGINAEGSNIAFYDGSNLTHLYAWIQSINITTIQIWVKNYNDSSKIDMQVLPCFENLFSANGHLGNISDTNVEKTVFGAGNVIMNYNVSNTTGESVSIGDYYGFGFITLPDMVITGYMQMIDSTNQYNIMFVNTSGYLYYRLAGTPSSSDINSTVSVDKVQSGYFYYRGYYGVWNVEGGETYSINTSISETQSALNIVQVSSDFKTIFGFNTLIMPNFTISYLYHSIDFKLLGSPFSSLWNIMVNGTPYQADSSNIYLNMTNGYYNIIVNLPAGYSAITKGVLYVNGTNQVYKIFVSYNNNSGISNDIIYAIILASIIVAAAIYFSKRS